MRIDVKECARLLLEQDDILILTHAHPDGDTLGCGFALCRALLQKGKFAYVKNEADIPPKYNYLFDDIVPIKFTPRFVVAVDVATEGLLGAIQGKYHIDLCIDHHGTNTDYADRLLLDDGAAAASEIIYKVIREMSVPCTSRAWTASCSIRTARTCAAIPRAARRRATALQRI